MDKKIFEGMRTHLAPDDKLIAKVLERAEDLQPSEADERFSVADESVEERGAFVRNRFGIAAAAAALIAAVGVSVLLYSSARMITDSSSDSVPAAGSSDGSGTAADSSASEDSVSDPSVSSDSSVNTETELTPNCIIMGSGQNTYVMPTAVVSSVALNDYAAVMEQVSSAVGKDVNVYNMTVPLASAYYLPDDLTVDTADQKAAISELEEHLEYVKNVNIYDTMKYNAGQPIYFHTDQHWTPLGAYYAMGSFFSVSHRDYQNGTDYGLKYLNISDYTLQVIDHFVGNTSGLYYEARGSFLNVYDEFDYYIPPVKCEVTYWDKTFTKEERKTDTLFELSNKYAYIYQIQLGPIDGEENIIEVDTGSKNGRVLVMVCDSFGNAAVPFIVNNFEKIYYVNIYTSDVDITEMTKKVGATDLLFLTGINAAGSASAVDRIRENLKIDIDSPTGEQRAREAADQIILGMGKEKADTILCTLCDRSYQPEPGSGDHVIYGDKIYYFGKASITFSCVHDTVEAVYLNFGVPDFEEICLKKSDDEQRAIIAGRQIELGMSTEAADRQLEAVCDRTGTASGVNFYYSQGMFSKCYYFGKAVILFSYSDDKVDGVYLCLGSPDFIETEICLQNTDPNKRGIVYQVDTENYQDVTSSS